MKIIKLLLSCLVSTVVPKDPKPHVIIPGQKNYTVAGMDVLSITNNGKNETYDKVLIMLHGSRGSGYDWNTDY
jgi:hypothetical protein